MGREIARPCGRPKHRTMREQLSELGGHLAHSISTLRPGLLSDNPLCIAIPMAEIPCNQMSAKMATFVFQEQLRSSPVLGLMGALYQLITSPLLLSWEADHAGCLELYPGFNLLVW